MQSDHAAFSSHLQRTSITKNIKLINTLIRLEFSGKLKWADESGTRWVLFLNSGRIIYAIGGNHSIRRWRRNIQLYCPHLQADFETLAPKLADTTDSDLLNCQSYVLLCSWLRHHKITTQNAAQIIQNSVEEILFDISRVNKTTYKLQRKSTLPTRFIPVYIDEKEILERVQTLWKNWQEAGLTNYSPDQAPVIKMPNEIKASTNKQLYQVLVTLLDGRHTLRDIAIKVNRDIFQITQALHSYIQFGWIDLIDILDYSFAVAPVESKPVAPPKPGTKFPLIACVDDSVLVCQSMEKIVKSGGYEFIGVVEAHRAIAKFLSQKPDLIFLDLVMPSTNGYEICSQLRKVSKFKEVPIIILSGNDGVVDQIRARLAGATDFVSKPVGADVILSVIRKYLKHTVPT
ncbi:MAG: response regulator [Elainellaceae cyanobacterium]